jgi:hypothetical protein
VAHCRSSLGRQTTNSTFRLLGAGLLGECESVVVIVQQPAFDEQNGENPWQTRI